MKLQRKLQNGSWVDVSQTEQLLAMAVERDAFFAQREQRPQRDRQGILDALAAGQRLAYDTDWYAEIRDGDVVKSCPAVAVKQTLCDCGHYTAHPMTTSSGTSCADCYDRMDN